MYVWNPLRIRQAAGLDIEYIQEDREGEEGTPNNISFSNDFNFCFTHKCVL